MTPSVAEAPPIAASTAAGRHTLFHVMKVIKDASRRGLPGAAGVDALILKLQQEGRQFDRFVQEVEAYASAQLEGEVFGRRMARRRRDLRGWAGSLLALFIPWVTGDGPTRAKLAAAAVRDTQARGEEIAAAAIKLLQLLERNAGARALEMARGAPFLPVEMVLPNLRGDLLKLVDVASGERARRARVRESIVRELNELPLPAARGGLQYGAQGFIAEVDAAMPFLVSSAAMIDLWEFVSGRVIGESAVRAARQRRSMRTT